MLKAVHSRHRDQRGLSLVEMMVGIAVGLVVVAAATLMVTVCTGDEFTSATLVVEPSS